MNVQSSPTMFYSLVALAAGALVAMFAIEAQQIRAVIMSSQSKAIQDQASLYMVPPVETEVTSAIRGFDLDRVTFGTLKLIMDDVETTLVACAATGRDMLKVSKIRGMTVHRGWHVHFQNCMEQRAREIQILGRILEDRQGRFFTAGAYLNPTEAKYIIDLTTKLDGMEFSLAAAHAVEKGLAQQT